MGGATAALSVGGGGRAEEPCGVGCPVRASHAAPADSCAWGEAQCLGQHGGGQAGGQVDEGGAPTRGWFDAEAPQALTELVGGEGQPGVEPWEQPRRGRWRADATVGTAGADETVEELVEGRGDFERCRPEVQARYVGSGFHLVVKDHVNM